MKQVVHMLVKFIQVHSLREVSNLAVFIFLAFLLMMHLHYKCITAQIQIVMVSHGSSDHA